MKQGNKISSFVVVLFATALAMYLIFSLWESLIDPFTTTIAYPFTISDSVISEGFIVREEYVLPDSGGLLDILPEEGEQVAVGQVVARVYASASAMTAQASIASLEKEVAILEYATAPDDGKSSLIETNLWSTLASMQRNISSGNFSQLESHTHTIKSNTLRQSYLYGSTLDALTLEQNLLAYQTQIISQSSQIVRDTTTITAPVSGAYSIMVDGLEWVTPSVLDSLSYEQFSEILRYPTTSSSTSVGKLITGDTWYYVTTLPTAEGQSTRVGDRVTLQFAGDFSQSLSMQVASLTPLDDGYLVILSTNKFLEQTSLLRQQRAEIIYKTYEGLRIPKTALRIQETTRTDSETGEEIITQTFGVYVISAGYAEFKPAKIVAEEADYYLVVPTVDNANALRAGNEVIVNARGLYNGKLLEY